MEQKSIVKTEDEILQGFITNDKFCHTYMNKMDVRYLESELHQIVFGWLFAYYKTYGKAIRNDADFKIIFERSTNRMQDKEKAELIKGFLLRLSKAWESKDRIHEQHLFDVTDEHFYQRSMALFQADVEACSGNVEKIKKAYASFSPFTRAAAEKLSLFNSAPDKLFAPKEKSSIAIEWRPKLLNYVIGRIKSTDLVAFLGPQKRGKTMFLVFTALQALSNCRRVWYYSLEMPEEEIADRFLRSAYSYHVYEENEEEESYNQPYFKFEDDEDSEKSAWEIVYKKGVLTRKAQEYAEKYMRRLRKSYRPGDIEIRCRGTNSFSVRDLRTEIEDVLPEDRPEVVVIDYADIMKPEYSRDEKRTQIAKIWSDLRGLALEKEIAIITASQTNRSGMERDVKASEIAEDISKVGQVTSLIALNTYRMNGQEDKQENVMVLQQIASRRGLTGRRLIVTQNLTLSRAVTGAAWLDYKKKEEEGEQELKKVKINRKKTMKR